ncbi:valyl-tRNA synthetase [Raphidocelis subcapitata]|uniref:valine--tRNA ligase n=1 Tax=Raphidocelis subcapitata TaxID=307507 RepID=A0A2V0P839_9CHLO|nr:valyl-tRNA synthetase [Raphidocelis subcapitata]|eukprot:GBF93255.1 valyl-tRNA synthetase [Raphidocelis subcapitata]
MQPTAQRLGACGRAAAPTPAVPLRPARRAAPCALPRHACAGAGASPSRLLQPLARPCGGGQRSRGLSVAAAASSAAVQPAAAAEAAAAPRPTGDLPKNFDPAEAESRLYAFWQSNGWFSPDDSAPKAPYTIPMPPPNVTGKLHMGHAMFVTLQDIMARYRRMAGHPTLWLPGTDHAGIATQSVVERQVEASGGSREAMGRDAFVERVWEWKREYGGAITNQMRRLGASCDWSRERFTLDEGLSAAVAEAFLRLHEKGLIYRGTYMVNWSPKLGTAVSDLEVEYSEEPGHLYYFKYPVAGSPGEFLPVATTRPETILGDTAVAVHPEDPRYARFVGARLEVPMGGGRTVPVIADDYVDREFGTGALKITPGHDPNDYEIGRRRGLEVLTVLNRDGSVNAAGGAYAGLDRFDARRKLWSDMEAAGLAIKKEDYTLRVPRSQRGGEVVEPLVSEQWFVKTAPLAGPALEAVARGDVKIVPERFEKVYNRWLEGIKDWCISRQLWWGHRIPVYYVHDGAEEAAAAEAGRGERYVVARSADEAAAVAAERYGPGKTLVQEQDVLDTWFSSGLWPFSTLGWPDEGAEDYRRYYPTQMLETGHDILFFWVARMVMMGLEFTGRAPFSTIYLHGLVRDDKGRKMSKSLGNVVDPLDVARDYGADALRFTMATGTAPGQDLNLSLDRVNANRNFTNKVWNIGKYILFNLEKVDDAGWAELAAADFSSPAALAALPLAERWVVSGTHELAAKVTAWQEANDFSSAGQALYAFIWGEFADWYVEASKARLYGADAAAAASTRAVLVYCFDRLLRLAHPFIPFVTEELWQALPHSGPALIAAAWPEGGPVDAAAVAQFEALKDTVRSIRNARAEYGVEPSRKIGAVVVAAEPGLRAAAAAEAGALALLAKLDPERVLVVATLEEGAAAAPPDARVSLVVREGLQVLLPMAGLFDAAKELARLEKQRAKVEKDLAGITARLGNPNFVSKAGAAVIDEARAQAADAGARLAEIDSKLQQVRALAAAA